MKRQHGVRSCVILAAVLVASCRTAPRQAPPQAAAEIADQLVAGHLEDAAARFEAVSGSQRHREVAYSVLYERAQTSYEQGDYGTAVRVLRFLVERYPRAGAPREALLYALFLERARTRSSPDEKTLAEMESLAAEVARRDGGAPVWPDLVRTQAAIDRGRYGLARDSLTRFRARWDGRPRELGPYVVELDRFLTTHGEGRK